MQERNVGIFYAAVTWFDLRKSDARGGCWQLPPLPCSQRGVWSSWSCRVAQKATPAALHMVDVASDVALAHTQEICSFCCLWGLPLLK